MKDIILMCPSCGEEYADGRVEQMEAQLNDALANWEHFADLVKEYHSQCEKLAVALKQELNQSNGTKIGPESIVIPALILAEYEEFKKK